MGFELGYQPLCCWWLIWPIQKWWKTPDWNPGKWVLIWQCSVWAFQWIPTWQGLDGFQKCLHPCPLDESSLSIGRVMCPTWMHTSHTFASISIHFRTYLKDLVETVHLFLKLLENYCKGTTHIMVQKKKKKAKRKKKQNTSRYFTIKA